jgi:hypothetical protein
MIRTKGFTLVDLLVVILCAVILATLSACMSGRHAGGNPEVEAQPIAVGKAEGKVEPKGGGRIWSARDVMVCQSNFKGIGMAIAMYRAENKDARFPLLLTTGQPEADIKASHAARTIDGLKKNLVGSEAAMQNVWILIDKGLSPKSRLRVRRTTTMRCVSLKTGTKERLAKWVGRRLSSFHMVCTSRTRPPWLTVRQFVIQRI